MKKEYKKAIKEIIHANKLHNKANPFFNRIVDDAQYDLIYSSVTNCWELKNKQKAIANTNRDNIIIGNL